LEFTQIELTPVVQFAMRYGPTDDKISQLYKGQAQVNLLSFNHEEIESLSYLGMAELLEMAQNPGSMLSYWFRQLILWYFGKPSDVCPIEQRS
jgi:isopentenyldiphosphate isomerase